MSARGEAAPQGLDRLLIPAWPWNDFVGPTVDVLRALALSSLAAVALAVLGQDWYIVPAAWCVPILLHTVVEPVILVDGVGIGTFVRSRARHGPLYSSKTSPTRVVVHWRDLQGWRRVRWLHRDALLVETRTGPLILMPAGDAASAGGYLDDIEKVCRERTVVNQVRSW